jgi:glutathione S-transferase
MAIKLHTCGNTWIKGPHPCWQVKKALNEQKIPFEEVGEPLRRGKRDSLEALSGQRMLPVIEFEDGTAYRAESKVMAKKIRDGGLESPGVTSA